MYIKNLYASNQTSNNDIVKSIPLGVFLIILITLLAYFPALLGDFVWDDASAIKGNLLIKLNNGIWYIWFSPSFNASEVHYWPLVYTVLWIEYHLWGNNPFGYHLVNLVLHIFNAILVWLILRHLLARWAWLAAMIFAIHPVHVESVAWIIELKDVLSGMFYLLSLLLYLHFVKSKNWYLCGISLVLFIFALLSKSITVSLPLAILLLLWWKNIEIKKYTIFTLLPFFIIAVIFAIGDVAFCRHQQVDVNMGFSFIERIIIAGKSLWFYAYKLFIPVHLLPIYPRWNISALSLLGYIYPLTAAALILLLWRRRQTLGKGPLVSVLYFAITLGPVLGFIDFGYMEISFAADRFQYLASISLITLFASGTSTFIQNIKSNQPWIKYAIISILLLALGVGTWYQSALYKDIRTLFNYSVSKNPDSPKAYYVMGYKLFNENNLEEAKELFLKAIEVDPNFIEGYNNLGNVYLKQGDVNRAIAYFKEALRINPSHSEALNNLGFISVQNGNIKEGIKYFKESLRSDPYYLKAINNLGIVLVREGKTDEALQYYSKAISKFPLDGTTQANFGYALLQKGEYEEAIKQAIKHLTESLRLEPNNAEAHYSLANAFAVLNKVESAKSHYTAAININPYHIKARGKLANILFYQLNFEEAIPHYLEIIRVSPDNAEIYKKLGLAYFHSNKIEESIKYYREALRINPDMLEVAGSLAWILATTNDAKLRNGAEAVKLAAAVCSRTDSKASYAFDTLAAAYAEAGDFDNAIKNAQKALDLVRQKGRNDLAKEIEERLILYKNKQPFHK